MGTEVFDVDGEPWVVFVRAMAATFDLATASWNIFDRFTTFWTVFALVLAGFECVGDFMDFSLLLLGLGRVVGRWTRPRRGSRLWWMGDLVVLATGASRRCSLARLGPALV